jgi:hypothetical protein
LFRGPRSWELLERATRGSALEVMVSSALTDDAQEQIVAFLEKRRPVFKKS